MSEGYHKKKQPEQVRAKLLEAATRQIVTQGFHSLRLESVAREAGVTKGGLLHHFPSKVALLEGLYEDGAQRFEQQLTELMAADPVPHGRFTRAYLRAASFEDDREGTISFFALVVGSNEFKCRTIRWMQEHLESHAGTDGFPEAHVVFHATHGLWMSIMLDQQNEMLDNREKTRQTLLEMTYPKQR